MKTKYSSIVALSFSIMALLVAGFLSSCGGDEPGISKQDDVRGKLISSTWKISSVTVDGTDKSSVYPNLSVTFTSTGFTTLNGGVVWPSTGTWTFTSDDATAIARNDGLVITIQEISNTSLKLGLTWNKNTIGPGRLESVSGQHVFSFGK